MCCPSLEVPIEVDDEVICRRKFKLSAVINHCGNLGGGHYTCLVKEQSGEWFQCNDKAVIPFKLEDLVGAQPYVLFYESS